MDVFVSRPTRLSSDFEEAYRAFHGQILAEGFKVRRLGSEDYSMDAPLKAVIRLIRDSCGAIVLGYPQAEIVQRVVRGVECKNDFRCVYPTPWNQIEGALAYACESPTLVIAHDDIDGGVFDHGVTGENVLHLNLAKPDWFQEAKFAQPFKEWAGRVRACAGRRPVQA